MLELYLTKSLILLSEYNMLVSPPVISLTEFKKGDPEINKAEDEWYLLYVNLVARP